MRFVGEKFDYCHACRERRRIRRCRACWGEGAGCDLCHGTGYMCEKADRDRHHRWKSLWF